MCTKADGIVQLYIRAQLVVSRFPAPPFHRLDKGPAHASVPEIGSNPPSFQVRHRGRLASFCPGPKREGSEATELGAVTLPHEHRLVGEVVAVAARPQRPHHLGYAGHFVGTHETDGHRFGTLWMVEYMSGCTAT